MRNFIYICFLIAARFSFSAEVALITTKEASAKEFVKLVNILDKKNISWEIFAVGEGEAFLKKSKVSHSRMGVWMPKKQIEMLSYDDVIAFAKVTAKACKKSKIIITEISDPFIARLHFELGLISTAKRWIYYPDPSMNAAYEKSLNQILKTHPEGVVFACKEVKEEIQKLEIEEGIDIFTMSEESKSMEIQESFIKRLLS